MLRKSFHNWITDDRDGLWHSCYYKKYTRSQAHTCMCAHTHTELCTALCSCFTVVNISKDGLALVEFRDKCERQRRDTKHTDKLHMLLNAVTGEQNWCLARE